ncbi:MAG TPA: alpha/beta fold hydrolase [Solirubrobacterales bacterium]|nr:alpha/beta fold hydrolase [Solirubrobacterales bacterium]
MAGARERLGAVWGGRRRWWLGAALALLAVLAIVVAVSWHFSDAVVVPDHSSYAPQVEVEGMPPGRIVLARDADSERPGAYGLEWPGGHAVAGAVLARADDTVTRRLRDVRGYLVPEMKVGIESDVFVGDPRQALGLPYRQVAVPDELGPMPAWLVPAGRPGRRGGAALPATWAIFVHGINGSRENGLRLVPALHRAGLPTLLISYREDQGAPASPDGFHHMGQTEWFDLEAAVRYALTHGARRLVLAGASMGGAIVAQFMEKSALADRVAGLVLDAPVLDWRATLEFHATEMGLPGFSAMPVEWAVGARIDADWDSLDAVSHPDAFQLPILLFHGTDDEVVPIATSDAFAAELPARVTYYRVPHAGHVQSWNVDPSLYDRRLTSFLASLEKDRAQAGREKQPDGPSE